VQSGSYSYYDTTDSVYRTAIDLLPPTSNGYAGPNIEQIGATSYHSNAGLFNKYGNSAVTVQQAWQPTLGTAAGSPTYTGSLAALPADQFVGPFSQNSQTRIVDVKDGTSNTIAFGESRYTAFQGGQRTVRASWAGAGNMPGFIGARVTYNWGRYTSAHPNIINFALCDGSVRTIKKFNLRTTPTFDDAADPEWTQFATILGMVDGFVTNWDPLGGQ